MFLDVFSDNSFETNCWMLGTEGTDEAVVVDPGFSPQRVHAMLETEGKRPVAALATHGHYDHIGAAAEFCGTTCPCSSTGPTCWRLPTPKRGVDR